MRKLKVFAAAAAAAALLVLTGCGQNAAEETTAAETTEAETDTAETSSDDSAAADAETTAAETDDAKTRIVVDHTGKEIELPAEIDRIVISSILPLPSVYCLFEGSAEKLVGMHPSSMAAAENSILPKVMPDILEVNTDFLQGDEINVEELMNLDPDVVF